MIDKNQKETIIKDYQLKEDTVGAPHILLVGVGAKIGRAHV